LHIPPTPTHTSRPSRLRAPPWYPSGATSSTATRRGGQSRSLPGPRPGTYLHVTEKRNQKRRKILLDAARSVLAYVQRAGIQDDKDGPLFRPMTPDATRLIRRPLDRKTPWR